jgi:hypothetical protein
MLGRWANEKYDSHTDFMRPRYLFDSFLFPLLGPSSPYDTIEAACGIRRKASIQYQDLERTGKPEDTDENDKSHLSTVSWPQLCEATLLPSHLVIVSGA